MGGANDVKRIARDWQRPEVQLSEFSLLTNAKGRNLEVELQRPRDGVGPIRRLVYTQKQEPRCRCVTHLEVRVKRNRAVRTQDWCRRRRTANSLNWAPRYGCRWSGRAHATLILCHGRSLEVLVVELLVAEFHFRRKVSGQLVFEYCDNFVIAADTFRIVCRSRVTDQKKATK